MIVSVCKHLIRSMSSVKKSSFEVKSELNLTCSINFVTLVMESAMPDSTVASFDKSVMSIAKFN